jgi:hypothetical protein
MGQAAEEESQATDLHAAIQAIAMDEMISSDDPDAYKRVYAAAFRAWADGKITQRSVI